MEANPATKSNPNRTRVLLVDDHPVVRSGWFMVLTKDGGFEICGEAESAREALDRVHACRPDVILADLDLEGGSGLDLIAESRERFPHLPILVVSMHREELYAERVIRAGGRGYVMKTEPPERLVSALRTVLAGGIHVSDAIKDRVVLRLSGNAPMPQADEVESLSNRELQIFRYIGEGKTTKAIADTLFLSVKTVESHLAHIKTKLRLQNASELQFRAYRWLTENSLQ